MSVPVPLEELRAELDRRSSTVYLLTVGDNGRPHCVAVRSGWRGDELEIRTGDTSARNARARPGVTLLAPPQPSPGHAPTPAEGRPDTTGYSLIVDGDATGISPAPEGGAIVGVRPSRAVFHRPASSPDGAATHDCVPVLHRTQAGGNA